MNITTLLQYSSDLKVLYIEDDEAFASEAKDLFQSFFLVVDLAKNGEEGLRKYKEAYQNNNQYDLVITDINMPFMNGIELTKAIYEVDPNQPIIVISAHNDSEYLLEFVNIGIEYFIVKPFNIEEIVTVLHKVTKKIQNSGSIVTLANGYTWDRNSLSLLFENKPIKLTKKEIMFFKMLIDNGTSITKTEDIFFELWGDKVEDINTDVLNPMISRLRKKLPKQLIKSVYGLGYTLYYEVE